MNKTAELLGKIKAALQSGALGIAEFPLGDVLVCVQKEIELNRPAYSDEQYAMIMDQYGKLCNSLQGGAVDVEKSLLLLDCLSLCLNMISSLVYELATVEYWKSKHTEFTSEIQTVAENIAKKKRIDLINYDFVEEYDNFTTDVYQDEEGWLFLLYRDHRMYFPLGWTGDEVVAYIKYIVVEQDGRSPHCYRKDGYGVKYGDVVLDVGGAEGFFALDCLGIASKIVIIEADEGWMAALKRTFAGYLDRVQLVYAYADKESSGNSIAIDDLFADSPVNYIKMDIEGFEMAALQGAVKTFEKAQDLRCAICAYHRKEDESQIKAFLEGFGYETATSDGYMNPNWTQAAYLDAEVRRGIVFGKRG